MKRLNKKGFTLVELLAVIVVLALLMVVAASSIGSALENSRKKALSTETQKLFTNITAEAQSLKMISALKTTGTDWGQYTGQDGDYKYDVTVNTHGYIIAMKVCYNTDYHFNLTVGATSGITSTGTYSTALNIKDELLQETDGGCSGSITVSDTAPTAGETE